MIQNPQQFTFMGPAADPVTCQVSIRFNRNFVCQVIMLTSFMDDDPATLASHVGTVRDAALAYLQWRGTPTPADIVWFEHQPARNREPEKFWRIDWSPAGHQKTPCGADDVRQAMWAIPARRARPSTLPRGFHPA